MRDIISIHSLTRRLTRSGSHVSTNQNHFNSQPHKEADRRTNPILKHTQHFNSQPHKEADDNSFDIGSAIIFQFTASQGG